MNNPFLVYFLFYYFTAVTCAAGGSLFIVTRILDRSNNIGDSYGSFDDHCRSVIHEEAERDDISLDEGRRYLIAYGNSPFESDNSKAPEALKKNDDIYGELEDVDIPLFKPLA